MQIGSVVFHGEALEDGAQYSFAVHEIANSNTSVVQRGGRKVRRWSGRGFVTDAQKASLDSLAQAQAVTTFEDETITQKNVFIELMAFKSIRPDLHEMKFSLIEKTVF